MSAFSQSDKARSELFKAEKLAKDEKYDEALTHVQEALKIDSVYLEALELKANIMLTTERSKELVKEVDDLIQKYPQQPEYYYVRAIVNLYKQRSIKAKEDLENCIYYQMPAKYMDRIYLNLGIANYNIGDFEGAETEYKNALDINPKYSAVYHSWGMLKYEIRQYEDAVKYFLNADKYENNNPVILYNLAMSYFRLDELENACYYFNKSCLLDYRNSCKVYLLECSE